MPLFNITLKSIINFEANSFGTFSLRLKAYIHFVQYLRTCGWALLGPVLTDIYRPVWCGHN
jgi:hypothetical protein